ncbi:transposase, partial [Bacillus sp. JJ864]|uniref:RNA-guided endonuclease InsQ/TnpB family protein n=1 Tax=Bacillus sp. JJ864 TaxID=3122975 RepID=UPI002FFF36BC
KNQDVKAYFIKSSGFLEVERHRIKIPTLGWIRLKEYGYIPFRNAKSATISQKAGRYYVSILSEVEQKEKKSVSYSEGIGVDLGIKDFAACSDGTVYKNINKTTKVRELEKKLKREQRSLSRKYENLKKRGEKTATKRANINKNIFRVQKLHARLANIRLEYIKFIVNQLVITKPSYITIEDLNVKGMM